MYSVSGMSALFIVAPETWPVFAAWVRKTFVPPDEIARQNVATLLEAGPGAFVDFTRLTQQLIESSGPMTTAEEAARSLGVIGDKRR